MTGETVEVVRRVASGFDDMGDETWREESERVPGCLVRPLPPAAVDDPKRPRAARATYDVAFPKAYTATARPLRGCRVRFPERGGELLDVVGSPDVTRPCPTAWDLVARCEATHG